MRKYARRRNAARPRPDRMIIAVANPKGGVGKTTTAVNVAAVLADTGRSVLIVDLEADLNASISAGIRPASAAPSIAELLLREKRAVDAIRRINGINGLHLITGSPRLSGMDMALRNVRQPERRLADVIAPLITEFDAIIIDAPSGYSLLARSVPLVAQHLVIPTRAEYLSLESLAQFLRWYRDEQASGRATAHIAGILLAMVDGRRQATREIVEIIRAHNRHGVLRTEIPEDPRAAEAPSHGVPLVRYSRSRSAVAYERLTGELLRRITAAGRPSRRVARVR
jgi:chromosome partitioning protein